MFGVIVSGRPVLTTFDKLSDTQIKFSIPSIPTFNHLVVFTLPNTSQSSSDEVLILGISLEPAEQVEANLIAMNTSQGTITTGQELTRLPPPALVSATPATLVSTKVLAQRIIANAFNFLASFSSGGSAGNEVVPLKSFQEWWKKFEKKIEMDPGFLERESG